VFSVTLNLKHSPPDFEFSLATKRSPILFANEE
jgi:hypothetical protein